MTLLAVQGLGKAFGGVHANQDVSLAVRAGTVHSIIGPNGAGKTSLINMLSGVYRPDAGSIRLAASSWPGCRRTASLPPASAAPSRTCRCSST